MKIQLAILFFTLFLSVDLFAQNPTWISNRGSMNYTFNKYDIEGYNEQAYLWQDALLKGGVQSCIISEIVDDSILIVDSKYGMYYDKLSYNMEFVYDDDNQLNQLIINDENIKYKSPKSITNIRKESLSWVLGQLQTRAYWLNDECNYIVNYGYNDAGQVEKEQWSFIYQSAQEVNIFPFEILYEYKKKGGHTITGIFKKTFESEKGITKYLLEFNEQGRLIKRTLYNRELRSREENVSSKLETFVYMYNEEGYLTSMASTKGTDATVVHCYKYINEDHFGNWQIQQVFDDKKTLLFEMKRNIKYR